ncbi:amidase [Telmatospirillum siberiense]|uniref:Amidase n=1 Tax=Telmatospirillum siberiense TaxID=382514 RepID=A0A2N3PPS1_9PROT|nr:amidase [Telmatospirillum siberiense]PKU22400.1 amidase [Telmatospirillum siberiense]
MSRAIPGALAAARAIVDGSLTAEALTRACLERIAAREPEIHAWTYLGGEAALAEARALDRQSGGGPLKGLPIAVKDLIDTGDMPTAYGSALYARHRPARDASCVALARSAGAIVLGKTVTTEFAYFEPGPTGNPHNPRHTPGGSSSGSAAAVADGMVPLAFGTQTAGSIIRPAAFCGCVGYKPTFGLLDVTGIRPFAVSLDTLGVLAADVADAAFFVSVLAGRPTLRVDDRDWDVPRIGCCRTPEWPAADAAMQGCLLDAADRLGRAGASVSEVVLPAPFDALGRAQWTVMAYEAARSVHPEMRSDPSGVSPKMRALAEAGAVMPAEDYMQAKELAVQAAQGLTAAMAGLDLLMVPAACGEAPEGLASTGDPLFNRGWTLLGNPAVAVPCGTGPKGLPLSVQLIGRRGGDCRLLAAAAWVERALRSTDA